VWTIEFTNTAKKDRDTVKNSPCFNKVRELLSIIANNPFQNPPNYEKLQPHRNNVYSRRINKQHRLVYEVNVETKYIRILSVWTHYEQ
jgi:toxin YoeB